MSRSTLKNFRKGLTHFLGTHSASQESESNNVITGCGCALFPSGQNYGDVLSRRNFSIPSPLLWEREQKRASPYLRSAALSGFGVNT
jgi:hypothetical protein